MGARVAVMDWERLDITVSAEAFHPNQVPRSLCASVARDLNCNRRRPPSASRGRVLPCTGSPAGGAPPEVLMCAIAFLSSPACEVAADSTACPDRRVG